MVSFFLVTGFLGSGKTTLVNTWLKMSGGKAPNGGRLGLLVNDFGELGLDNELLVGGSAKPMELAGGCVCCKVNESLEKTCLELHQQFPDLEAIVLEASGLAEPLPIAWTLGKDSLSSWLALRAIVTVVDAENHAANFEKSPCAQSQIELADFFVVRKADLVSPSQLEAVLNDVRAKNPGALLPEDPHAPIAQAERIWQLLADPSLVSGPAAMLPRGTPHHHDHNGLDSTTLALPGIFDADELCDALETLPADYFRIKGIVEVGSGTGDSKWVAFHRVGARVSFDEVIAAPSLPRVTAIGRSVSESQLREVLQKAMLQSS